MLAVQASSLFEIDTICYPSFDAAFAGLSLLWTMRTPTSTCTKSSNAGSSIPRYGVCWRGVTAYSMGQEP